MARQGKGKQKGSKWEHDVAKALTEWFGADFRRVPSSGALRWSGKSFWTWGDIVPPAGLYVLIECKHHAEIALDECLGTQRSLAGTGRIVEWWENQCLRDASRAAAELGRKVEPFLIWKQDRVPPRLCMSWQFFSVAELASGMPFFTICFDPEKPGFVCVNFRQFLEKMSPEKFEKLVSITN